MDINRLTMGEKIVLFSSGLLVILSFIPMWASYSFEGLEGLGGFDTNESFNAWSGAYGFLVKLAIILAVVAVVVTVLRAVGTALPDMPISLGLLYVGLGAIATVGLLIGVLTGPEDGGAGALLVGLDISRGLLLFVGVVLALAMTYGGYMHLQSEGSASPAVGGPATPPPPPTA